MRERKNIKVRVDMFEDTKFKLIDRMKERDLINYIWFRIMTLAGKVNREGDLYLSKSTPYTVETLAVEFNREESEVNVALGVFIKLEMVDIKDNNVITVKNFVKHQGIKVNERNEDIEKEKQEAGGIEEDKVRNEDIVNFGNKVENKKKSQTVEKQNLVEKQNHMEYKDHEKSISDNRIIAEVKEIQCKNSHNKDIINIIDKKQNNNSIYKFEKNANSEIREILKPSIISCEDDEGIPLLVDADEIIDINKEFIDSIGQIEEEEEEMCGFIDEEAVKALGTPIRSWVF